MKKLLLTALTTLGIPALGLAADISLNTSDTVGTTSFNTALHWSDGNPPSAANEYFTSDFILRTPPDSGSYTFAGNSLTVNNANGYPNGLLYKGALTGGIITINNLILDGGFVSHASGSGDFCTLAGNINVVTNSTIYAKQGNITVTAAISGAGGLTIPATDAPGEDNRYVNLLGNNSGFTGKLNVLGRVRIISEAGLGGNPGAFAADQLTLDGGANGGWLVVSNTFAIDDINRGITIGGNGAQIFVSNPDTNTVANLTIASPITGGALTKRGGGVLTLSGNNDFFGGLTLRAATAGSQLNVNSATALGIGPFTISADGNTPVLDNTSGSSLTLAANFNTQTWNNNLTFLGSSSLNMAGLSTVNMFANVTATVSNNTLTVGQVFDDGLNRVLTKQGPGTLAIDGGGFYLGNTVVNEGVLALINSSSLSSPRITVATNATLDVSGLGLSLAFGQTLGGSGTVLGNVTDGGGNTVIDPGTSPGTLTINGNLDLIGGTALEFELGSVTTVGSGVNDLLVVAGQLNLAGPTTINITGTPATGTYTLIQYGSLAGSIANLSTPPGYALNDTGSAIELVVTHVPTSLTWRGDGILNTWDLGVTSNWVDSGSAAAFLTGDSVTFDNTGSNSPAITLNGDQSPASVTVNASQDYTLTGGGIISGSLTKDGSGTLVLDNTNTYSGPTVINGGTLQLGDPFAGAFGLAGTIGTGPVTNLGNLLFNRIDDLTIAANINGSGSISNAGSSGVVTLSGNINDGTVTMAGFGATRLSGSSNSYDGLTLVASGTLFAGNSNTLGSATAGTEVYSGANLYFDLNQPLTIAEPLTLDGGQIQRGGGQALTYEAPIVLGAGGGTFNADGGSTIIPATEISGPGALTKAGNGTLMLTISNSYTGKTFINGGTLQISSLDVLGPNPGVATPDFVTLNGGTLSVTNDQTFSGGNRGLTIGSSGLLGVQDAAATLTVSGDLNGGGTLSKRGPGTLVLSGSNPWFGTSLFLDSTSGANDGITRIASPTALANLTVSPGASTIFQGANNAGWSTLQLDGSGGNITLAQDWDMNCRNNDNPNIQNVAGNNTISGTINLNVGGNRIIFQSDAGLLTISGNQQYVGTLTGGRTYTFTGAGNILVSGAINNSSNGAPISLAKNGSGTTTLSAANSYGNTTTINDGVLNLTGSISSTGGVFVAGGALAGNGSVGDSVTVNSSSASGTIDTYSVSGDYTIDGYLAVDVNRSGFVSDHPTVSGALSSAGTGLIIVNNLGAALQVGDTFTLFNKAVVNGAALGISGAGVTWNNNLAVDGTISVASATVPQPQINLPVLAGGNLTLSGSGGPAGGGFQVISSTDAGVPLANWVVETNEVFDGSGNFNVSIAIPPNEPRKFYAILVP